jgi:ferredoxin
MELKIDRIACDGAGLCAELVPELISLDEWGYPIVERSSVTPALAGHVREAATLCPKLALRLVSSG